jgi:hypothetical protein
MRACMHQTQSLPLPVLYSWIHDANRPRPRGIPASLPGQSAICGLPLTARGSASRTKPFSRLNTQPTLSPVNASPRGSLRPTHDSGPLWLAKPLTYDSFIHYNLPVYPGALRWRLRPTGGITSLFRGYAHDWGVAPGIHPTPAGRAQPGTALPHIGRHSRERVFRRSLQRLVCGIQRTAATPKSA